MMIPGMVMSHEMHCTHLPQAVIGDPRSRSLRPGQRQQIFVGMKMVV